MPDSMPCIWMSAGLVAYKLCDREYDCESCPFDAAMRGCAATTPTVPTPTDMPEPEFPGDRHYHRGHLWVRSVGSCRVRIGLDAFGAELLRRALCGTGALLLPRPGTPARAGHPLCWIHDEAEIVALRSPITGRVTVTHGLVRHRPELLFEDPYGDGWLAELRVGARAAERNRALLGPARIRELSLEQRNALGDAVHTFVQAAGVGVGPTMQDGGESTRDPRTVLGARRYYEVISAFLI